MSYAQAMNPVSSVNTLASRPTPTESSSKIRDAISATEQSVGELHDAITAIEKRLDTILTPVAPEVGVTNGAGTTNTSHMHGRVVEMNLGFAHAIDRLRSIYQRVEV